jgi:phage shock protein PspC (stress-responsive transcriptional regulator)
MGPESAPPTPPSPPSTSSAQPAYPPYVPPPLHPRRLMRSSRERMWAGVAGGMAEYFDLDPSLVRLLWVAATVVSGGLAVPVYILAWILLPRDDRPPYGGPNVWRDWSQEFHGETQRLAEEARRVADDMREASHSWRAPGPTEPPAGESARDTTTASTGVPPEPEWWRSERYVERHHNHGRHPRSTGIVLVALGVFLLAANSGIFNWIEWRTMWPMIFIGLGVLLLARQTGWGR